MGPQFKKKLIVETFMSIKGRGGPRPPILSYFNLFMFRLQLVILIRVVSMEGEKMTMKRRMKR